MNVQTNVRSFVLTDLPHARHTGDDGGSECADIIEQLDGVSLTESNGSGLTDHIRLQYALVDVSKGKVGEHHLGGTQEQQPATIFMSAHTKTSEGASERRVRCARLD